MLIENLSYLATFVTTTGIAIIGALVSYQLFRENRKPVLQILFYQQIFLFSFFIYGIWGNIGLRQVISDVNVSTVLLEKLAFFAPVPGLPFLVTGWFMLLKFGFNLNGYQDSKKWIYTYFSGFLLLITTCAFLFQNHFFNTPNNPDVFLIRLFVASNLFFHLLFIYPFLKSKNKKYPVFKKGELRKNLLIYLASVVGYSAILWFFNVFGYISTNLSFLLLFASCACLPVCMKSLVHFFIETEANPGNNFRSFCTDFEISKREAEIIREICSGKTNKAIAEKLFITLQTVKDHTHHIYTKTRVKSRVQLANLVREKTGMTGL